ncbi:MAG: NUDIX hydrolase [Simkaniaceae bacterium]|nr:NUDIX hydrolase [Simkaniaceae bacterium]
MRETIYSLIEKIAPFDAIEHEHREESLKWIESGDSLFRTESPDIPPKHLVSYCILYDRQHRKILLVDHIKAELWIPPGGHVDLDEHPQEAAKRELKEELGISLPLLSSDPLFINVTPSQGLYSMHTDVTLWYVFEAEIDMMFQIDQREFIDAAWFHLSNIPTQRSHDSIVRFAKKLHLFNEKL